MATRKYIPMAGHDEGKHLAIQSMRMRTYFPCFKCSLRSGVLECLGDVTPCEECTTYRIRIRLSRGGVPKVKILSPAILPSPKIHIFSSGDLCLYDHRDQPWKETDYLHEKIVPWTAEWLVFYELFLLTGEWLGPQAPHGQGTKLPQLN